MARVEHWTFDPETGEPQCSHEEFHCPYAEEGALRCPSWRCDCFIETHPDSPFALHPEDFIVRGVVE